MFLTDPIYALGLPPLVNLLIFAALVIIGAELFVKGLIFFGNVFHLADGFLGYAVAIGVALPGIGSALYAILVLNTAQLGFGIILGACVWSICGMVGLVAIIDGNLQTRPKDVFGFGVIELVITFVVVLIFMESMGWVESIGYTIHLIEAVGLILFVVFSYLTIVIWSKRHISHPKVEDTKIKSGRKAIWAAVLALGLFLIISFVEDLAHAGGEVAETWGLPDFFVGFFFVAIIITLPELVASVYSVLKGRHQISIGTLLGTNILNLAFVVIVPALFFNITPGSEGITGLHLIFLGGTSFLAVYFMYSDLKLTRVEGSILIGLYAALFIVSYYML